MKSLILAIALFSSATVSAQNPEMLIRIAEIEIDSAYSKQYNELLAEEARASVLLEPGVIAIFPLFQKENPTQIRILEIYANQDAYESHLKTAHFLKYKNGSIKMVRSLKLIDMKSLDPLSLPEIFKKFSPQTDLSK